MENIHSIQDEIIEMASEKIRLSLDNILIEGLKIKGFEFKNENDLISFVASNCKKLVLSNQDEVYTVNGVQFLLIRKNDEIITTNIDSNTFKMSCDYGSYSYL